ncbi:MAG: DNA-directed RNA polymerase subunit beta', partial [Bacillota bacterium]
PKGQAVMTEVGGTVKVVETKQRREVRVIADDGSWQAYTVPFGARLLVRDGDRVEPGDVLTEGPINPHDILKIKGVQAVQLYLLQEVQKVYRMQGVDINDKHIEIIIRQMMRKVKVEDAGDTDLLPGGLVDVFEFEEANAQLPEGARPAVARPVLLGITKAALATESFLSAASFQETTRVLTEAAIKGKTDPLLGLKENVIIGKLIPAGTGMSRYRRMQILVEGKSEREVMAQVRRAETLAARALGEDGAAAPADGVAVDGAVNGPVVPQSLAAGGDGAALLDEAAGAAAGTDGAGTGGADAPDGEGQDGAVPGGDGAAPAADGAASGAAGDGVADEPASAAEDDAERSP